MSPTQWVRAVGRLGAAALCAVLMSACAGSPMRLSMMDEEGLKLEKTAVIAQAYGFGQYDNLRAELKRREAFTEQEWAWIDAKQLGMGMSVEAMYASWGTPSHQNSTVTRAGRHVQHVYGGGAHATYVYTENGRITSWQD